MADVKRHDAPVPQRAIDFLSKKIKVETEKRDGLKWGNTPMRSRWRIRRTRGCLAEYASS
jgi:hypothetical protein